MSLVRLDCLGNLIRDHPWYQSVLLSAYLVYHAINIPEISRPFVYLD